MMWWLALTLGVFSVVAGVAYLVLFKPLRVRRVAYWLYARSSLYRRWILHRFVIRPNKKIAAAMGAMIPALKRAALAMEKFGEALRKAGVANR